MIPALILYLIRRYRRSHPHPPVARKNFLPVFVKPLLLLLLCIAIAAIAFSQNRTLEYQIKRKGDVVGNILFTQISSGSTITLQMESEVKTRFIILFTAQAKEEAIYENGVMVWSSIYRKLNGSEKANKKTLALGRGYMVSKGERKEILVLNDYPIRYNMLSLYAWEPVNFSKVYSDNFQQFLNIQKIAPQHYKIKLPDGNYNEYFYKNGICSKVEIHHSLYSATIELKK